MAAQALVPLVSGVALGQTLCDLASSLPARCVSGTFCFSRAVWLRSEKQKSTGSGCWTFLPVLGISEIIGNVTRSEEIFKICWSEVM